MEPRLHVEHKPLAEVLNGHLKRMKWRSVDMTPPTSGGGSVPRVGEGSGGRTESGSWFPVKLGPESTSGNLKDLGALLPVARNAWAGQSPHPSLRRAYVGNDHVSRGTCFAISKASVAPRQRHWAATRD